MDFRELEIISMQILIEKLRNKSEDRIKVSNNSSDMNINIVKSIIYNIETILLQIRNEI